MKTISDSAVILKSYNSNIVSVQMNSSERILLSKGIGFGKKPGDKLPKGTDVEKIFVIEDEDNLRNFTQVIENTDEEFLMLCEKMISYIENELKENLNERIHIALVDHLNFAVKRFSNNEEIENPFLMEIKALYSTEYDLAEKVVKMLQNELKVNIPEGEIGFIALHIHSARNNEKVSFTLKSTYLISSIVEFVEEQISVHIDETTLDYARFLTHLFYLYTIFCLCYNYIIKTILCQLFKILKIPIANRQVIRYYNIIKNSLLEACNRLNLGIS